MNVQNDAMSNKIGELQLLDMSNNKWNRPIHN